jgi:hypothetical protein
VGFFPLDIVSQESLVSAITPAITQKAHIEYSMCPIIPIENKLLFFAQMFLTRPPLSLNYMSTFKLSDGKESATIS